jgi:hypothetical protein
MSQTYRNKYSKLGYIFLHIETKTINKKIEKKKSFFSSLLITISKIDAKKKIPSKSLSPYF